MANYIKDVTEFRIVSVWVALTPNGNDLEKVEVFQEYLATWRGEWVKVTAYADRYRHSNGLSDWRVWVRPDMSNGVDSEGNRDWGRPKLTEAATRAFNVELVPLMKKKLEGLDLSRALAIEIRTRVGKAYNPSEELAKLLQYWAELMPSELSEAFYQYQGALRNAAERSSRVAAIIDSLRDEA